jgi:hypothetical protein
MPFFAVAVSSDCILLGMAHVHRRARDGEFGILRLCLVARDSLVWNQ